MVKTPTHFRVAMKRIMGTASTALYKTPPASLDLIVTSPPAYPSLSQEPGALGTERSLDEYLVNLGRFLYQCRRPLKPTGYLVLVIEPIPGFDPMQPLHFLIKRRFFELLGTYKWAHGDGTGSWVVFLTKGRARLNRQFPAWQSANWAFPRPAPDPAFGFYEWPEALLETIIGLTIPNGGTVLDPFAGKAEALSHLPSPQFDVTAVDVKDLENANPNPSQTRPIPPQPPQSRMDGPPKLEGSD